MESGKDSIRIWLQTLGNLWLYFFLHGIYHLYSSTFGRYDDYDYGEVNQLLERSLKLYMKTVTCHPERVNRQLYNDFWREFKHSEKVN